jgi:hypothetical protein
VKPAAAAAEAAADSMLHASESLWSFLRLLNVFLNDVRAGKCDRVVWNVAVVLVVLLLVVVMMLTHT